MQETLNLPSIAETTRADSMGLVGDGDAKLSDGGDVGDLIKFITDELQSSKAEDVVVINIAKKSSIADFLVVSSGNSHRHVGSIAERLVVTLKKAGFSPPKVEGANHCDWVLIDAGMVVVHVFRPEVRDFYRLEKLWSANTLEA